MSLSGNVGKRLAPKITQVAPGLTTSFVREALNRAIDGVGPLPGAASAAALAGERDDSSSRSAATRRRTWWVSSAPGSSSWSCSARARISVSGGREATRD